MKSEDAHFRLRLPIGLHKQLYQSAEKNDRSINAEIVARLRKSFDWEQYDLPTMSADIQSMQSEISELKSNIERLQAALYKLKSDI